MIEAGADRRSDFKRDAYLGRYMSLALEKLCKGNLVKHLRIIQLLTN